MDHDRLFKELLTTFFAEFLQLFFPELAGYLDPDSVEFLDKELFTDVTQGERHEADLVTRARFRGQALCFLIHVENQAQPQANFPRRMFGYFARLHEKYDLPVYPIAVFSYDAPQRSEPKVPYNGTGAGVRIRTATDPTPGSRGCDGNRNELDGAGPGAGPGEGRAQYGPAPASQAIGRAGPGHGTAD
jgi:hypothetical protein